MDNQPGEVTLLLQRWSGGDRQALDALTPLVYRELHKIAASHLRRERNQATLQTTALIHEAYIRMVDQSVQFNSRTHFFGIAARLMRQILVDCARRKNAAQRGGGAAHVPLDAAIVYSQDNAGWILRLDAALEKLGALGVSLATVKRDLLMAETWLKREIAV